MRIGTWNIAGRWSDAHARLIEEADCDVWLLTEVSERVALPTHELHLSTAIMAPKRRWAAVASRLPMTPEPDPHPASARAHIGSTTFVSSILPWKGCDSGPPWVGDRHVDKTQNAVNDLVAELTSIKSLVWGGDWNHALTGKEYAGTMGGRRAVLTAVDELGLMVSTTDLAHPIDGLLSIDHIATPRGVDATASRLVAAHDGKRLSDHDAYVVEVDLQAGAVR